MRRCEYWEAGVSGCSADGVEEVVEVFPGELEVLLGAVIEEPGDEFALAVLHGDDLLFDGAPGDEFVDEDGLVLADSMGAVGGLLLDGGIPPRIVVDDGVGGSEVQTGAAGLEGDKEQRNLAGLEPPDRRFAVGGGAVKADEGDAPFDDFGFDEVEHGGELGEKEDMAAFFDHLGEQVQEEFEFR